MKQHSTTSINSPNSKIFKKNASLYKMTPLTKNPLTGLLIAVVTTLIFIRTGLVPNYSLGSIIGITIVAWLAAENGGNDVSKGVAPLVASGAAKEWTALIYGAIVTAFGGTLSIYFAIKLLKLFTGGLINSNYEVNTIMALSMAIGATLWVALATRFSLPVSTTHSIVGSVIMVGCVALGVSSVVWSSLVSKVVMPLLLSPLLGLSIAWALTFLIQFIKLPSSAGKGITWVSSGAICFVRAVNDTPKIVAITALVAITSINIKNIDALFPLFLLVTVSMSIGSLVKGVSVTQLLARKVAQLDNQSSVSSVLTTTVLVMASSQLGLPVSTTHVSTTAIIGAGLRKNKNAVNWSVVRDMVLSWIVTLPGAGILGILAYYILTFVK
ncbi:phosphate/sulfate permease [Anoxybacillus calidus]|uniref:Phosphate transporter n=1 Tax=[Anoxybacillus] calidus TaxID=575178 RepID=A0A7V9Z320_9BACL|nr:inorganic phosphate transporter [Anoxybacillus calidus]MBA2873172.1 phosphate/sulfate permease [Anoxybacillus calidus]